ncbi:hypothetical protein [Nocardioides insulae]|uniref:hypothetical protein n=1 Tax=Nocardioides insulae TaxID=394734 RepID=UPI0004003DA9|nr:hypothetical protein [Nocardioides insulae]
MKDRDDAVPPEEPQPASPEERTDPTEGASSPRLDEDAAWQAIVANFGDRAVLEESSEEPASGSGSRSEESGGSEVAPGPAAEPARFEEPDTDWYTPLEDDGAFVPPDPGPIRTSPDRLLAWAGVLGVPVLTVLGVMLSRLTSFYLPGWVGLLAVAAFIGGFVYLVATMPRSPDDPWDDGAQV